jgi:hypothetical protein
MEIEWADPPEKAVLRAQPGRYIEFAATLLENPDRWAKLPTQGERTPKGAAAAAQNIRRGVTKGFLKGAYEAVADDTTVYVRYVGLPEQPQQAQQSEQPEDPDGHDEDGDEAKAGDEQHYPTPPTPIRSAVPSPPRPASPDVVRAWAATQGFNVPTRGRLPEEIWTAYSTAHGPKETVPGY